AGRRAWLSGFFGSRRAAEEHFHRIPEDHKEFQEVIEVPVDRFPFYVLEDDSGFRFLNEAEAAAAVLRLEPQNRDSSENAPILYRIEEEWFPDKPGIDTMGVLWHVHL